jgi:hypothetical protein
MTLIVLGEAGEEFAESVQYYESKEVFEDECGDEESKNLNESPVH